MHSKRWENTKHKTYLLYDIIILNMTEQNKDGHGLKGFLTKLKAIIPKALSLERIVMVALFGVPSVTPLEELWNAARKAMVR